MQLLITIVYGKKISRINSLQYLGPPGSVHVAVIVPENVAMNVAMNIVINVAMNATMNVFEDVRSNATAEVEIMRGYSGLTRF